MTRGEVYLAKLGSIGHQVGSVQGSIRPVIIVQNDVGNMHSPTTLVVPVTSQNKHNLPTHFSVKNLHKNSIALCEQIQTVDKTQLLKAIGKLDEEEMTMLKKALMVSLALN